MTLSYQMTVQGCGVNNAIATYPYAGWGCGTDLCQHDAVAAYVTLPAIEPNLDYTVTDTMSACYGAGEAPDTIWVTIANNGAGPAHNVYLDFRVYDDDFMGFDLDAITYVLKSNGNSQNFTPSVQYWPIRNTYNCATQFDTWRPGIRLYNGMRGTFPGTIPAGDTLQVQFLVYKCCTETCVDNTIYNRFRYGYSRVQTLRYTNLCGTNPVNAQPRSKVREFLFSPTYYAPRTFFQGSGTQYAYIDWANFWINDLPLDEQTGYFELALKVPDCVDRAGTVSDIKWINYNNREIPYNTVISRNDSLYIRWEFNLNALDRFNARNSRIQIPLQADCSEAPCTDNVLAYSFSLIPSTNCNGCSMELACYEGEVVTNCQATCEGLQYLDYTFQRTSLGILDLDDNGCPDNDNFCDGTGFVYFAPVDSSGLRRDKAVDGDTVVSALKAVVQKTSLQNWAYLYIEDSLDTQAFLPISSSLKVKRGNTVYNCGSIGQFQTQDGYQYDLSLPTIGNCLSLPGGTFMHGDSIFFVAKYRIANTISRDFEAYFTKNKGYLSDRGNPTPIFQYVCNDALSMMGLVAVSLDHCCGWRFVWDSCESKNDFRNTSFSIAGGNLANNYFPFEYRTLGWPSRATYTLPPGWNFDSADLTIFRTRGSGRAVRMLPRERVVTTTNTLNADGTMTMEFDFQASANQGIWARNGGTLFYSDDGFRPEFRVFISPGCDAATDWNSLNDGPSNRDYDPKFYYARPDGSESFSNLVNRNRSIVVYNPPNIVANSPNQSLRGKTATVKWDFALTNLSVTSPAEFAWVKIVSPSGQTGTVVRELTDHMGTVIPQDFSGYYRLGRIGKNEAMSLSLRADYLSCDKDSLLVLFGWDCKGYPTTTLDPDCADTLALYVTPSKAGVSSAITPMASTPSDPSGTIAGLWGKDSVSMCTGFPVEVTISSNDEGAVFDPIFVLNNTLNNGFPGLSFVSGSGYIEYPIGTTPRAFSVTANNDLVAQNGQPQFSFKLNAIDPATFNTLGPLYGVDSVVSNKHQAIIRFSFEPNCDFGGGDVFRGRVLGKAKCGATASGSTAYATSAPLPIEGAVAPYATFISLGFTSNTQQACGQSTNEIRATITKIGTNPTGFFDEIEFVLPPFVKADIFTTPPTCYSSPVCPSPIVIDNPLPNGGTSISLFLGPTNLGNGDQMEIGLTFSLDDTLSCGLQGLPIEVRSKVPSNIDCNGTPCFDFKVISGRSEIKVNVEKPSGIITNAQATVSCPSGSGEQAQVQVDVLNTSLVAMTDAEVEIWYDANNNNQVDAADNRLTVLTLPSGVASAQTGSFTGNITFPQANAACRLLSVLRGCLCDTTGSRKVDVSYQNSGTDRSICPGQTTLIGCGGFGIPGYTYQWSPGTGLANFRAAQTVLTLPNQTGAATNSEYILTTTRAGGCVTTDTITIQVSASIAQNDTISSCELAAGTSTFDLTAANGLVSGGTGSSVAWFSNATYSSSINNPTNYNSGPGMVYARVSNSSTGCQDKASLKLELEPGVPTPSLPARDTICSSNSNLTNEVDNYIVLDGLVTGAPVSTANGGGNWHDIDNANSLGGNDFTASLTHQGNAYRFAYTVPGSSLSGACGPKSDTITIYVAGCFTQVSGRIWEDMNANGVQDPTEQGHSGLPVELFTRTGVFVAILNTDANGNYQFDGIPAGDYYIDISQLPVTYMHTQMAQGADPSMDSDFDPNTGRSPIFTIAPGSPAVDRDGGIFPSAILSHDPVVLQGKGFGKHRAILTWALPTSADPTSMSLWKSNDGTQGSLAMLADIKLGQDPAGKQFSFVDEQAFAEQQYYQVRWEDEAGTSHASNIAIIQTDLASTTWTLYPNPASSVVYLLQPGQNILSLELLDVHGRSIKKLQSDSNANIQKINVEEFSSGIYFVQIVDKERNVYNAKLNILR
ncbi:MAG: SdrD B-like domain-containing protein [Bacteroidia bacterium]